ncbi:C1 family peptidase [Mesorhizobium sp. M0991]|uniref:C1 family peptidase n=1 Tax=Mesorhizobium sp. M0991 TaxID=2957043 RepID=UPI00333D1556
MAAVSIAVTLTQGLAWITQAAHGQTLPPDDTTKSRGLTLEDGDVYGSFPESPNFRAFLPERIDLSKRMPPVGDQGSQGSCVGWAVGYAARSYYASASEHRDIQRQSNRVSPAFIYDSIRDNPMDCKEGSKISDALKLLTGGAVSQSDYRYDVNRCQKTPEGVKSKATDFKINGWVRVDPERADQVKGELANGHPVIFGMKAPAALETYNGKDVYAGSEMDMVEFHAVTAVGYDERKQAFRVINSWGPDWGDKGYFWISYDAVKRDVLQAYAMRLDTPPISPVEVGPVPQPQPQPKPQLDMPQVSCGRVKLVEAGDEKTLTGFVGEKAELDRLSSYAQASGAKLDVDLYPWPQCEVATTLVEVSVGDVPRIDGGRKKNLYEADILKIALRTPGRDSYLQMTYIQADGSAVNMMSADLALRQFRPRTEIVMGDGSDGSPTYRVKEPLGQELLVVVSSKSPLFAENRPRVETEREFLTALRRAVLYGKDGEGGRDIGASFQIIETHKAADR